MKKLINETMEHLREQVEKIEREILILTMMVRLAAYPTTRVSTL